MEKRMITGSREFGSGGRSIAKELAKKLGWAYYDKELVEGVAEKTGFDPRFIEERGEFSVGKSLLSYALAGQGMPGVMNGMSASDFLWCMQREVILKLAEEGGCVIVGRCADYVLRDEPELLRVFLTADRDDRIRRVCRRDGVTAAEAEEKLQRMDRSRAAYYRFRCDQTWGAAANYDLCINVSRWGVDAAVETIVERCSRS